MPHDQRHKFAPGPELTADEVRKFGDRTAAERDEQNVKSLDQIRKSFALLKRVDAIMERR